MFLSRRATQAEYFDSPHLPKAEIIEFYRSLASANRLFMFAEPFQRTLPALLTPERRSQLSILDLGAGDGSLGKVLSGWAAKRGWTWRITNLDVSFDALALNPGGRNVGGSVLALPFCDASFDLVIASQMTHHLDDAQVVQHLREAWRVTRGWILVSDLHRNFALYCSVGLLCRLHNFPKTFFRDAVLSLQRARRVRELQS